MKRSDIGNKLTEYSRGEVSPLDRFPHLAGEAN